MDSTHEQQASEAELLKAVARGDHSALERLYQYYEKRVFHYVRLFVQDQTLAEEVVAEVMVSVWRGACSFAHHSRVATWIFGIARHKAVDALRKTGRYDGAGIPLEDAGDVPSGCESPMEQAHRGEICVLTRRALKCLSLEHREVLRLVFYEELAYEQIACMLGIPENTVKTRVFYAKQHLRKELDRLLQRTPFVSEPLAQPGFTPAHPYAMLLPWYVTGRLEDQEEQEVAEHLAGCVSCRLELDQLTAMRGDLIAAYADQPGPSPKVREQVMAQTRHAGLDSTRTREAPPATRQTGAIERWCRGLFAPRWVPALAVALIVGQLGLLLWTVTGRQTDRTNGDSIMTRSISPSSVRLKISFHETAPEHRIREVLRALRGRIVDGPSADGMYVIEIAETDSPGLSERMTMVERQPDVVRKIERVTP